MQGKPIRKILAVSIALLMVVSCAMLSIAVDNTDVGTYTADDGDGHVDEAIVDILASSLPSTIYVPDDYAKIQWTVDNASAGYTTIVRDGTYYENLKIEYLKSLNPKIDLLLAQKIKERPEEKIPVIIVLRDKVKLKKQPSLKLSIQEAKSQAFNSQKMLAMSLKNMEAENIKQFWIINAIAAKVPANKIEEIANRPDVEKVWLDREIKLIDSADYPIEENKETEKSLKEHENNNYLSEEINQIYQSSNNTDTINSRWGIYANDTSNNWNVTDVMTFTVEDLTPPAIEFIPPTPANNSEILQNYVIINVSLTEDANNALLNWNGVNLTMDGCGTIFYLNMTDLSDGDYTYRVFVSDKAGNTGISETRKLTINVKDAKPPASISNLSYSAGSTWINWTWTNPEDDFGYVMVYLNGSWIGNTSDCYYNATGLNPNTTYEIGIRTVDLNGNINQSWTNGTAKTTQPPLTVSILSPVDGQLFGQNDEIQFSASVSGGLPPYTYNWTSSIDVFLGRDRSFATYLSAGEHIITLTVTDEAGSSITAQLNISVIPEPITTPEIIQEENVTTKEEITTGESGATIIVPDDYPTIQQAIYNAADGDIIFVRSGTYNENLVIGKDISLEGENRETTVIDGMGSDCIKVGYADVIISGFTIENGSYGIYGYGYRPSLNLSNVTVKNSKYYGIYFYNSRDLTIRNSIIENNGGGIYWDMPYSGSYDATIEKTIIRNNTGDGIKINDANNATVRDNLIINNTGDGIDIDASKVVLANTTINSTGGDGAYIDASNIVLANTTINSTGGDGLRHCSNITFSPPLVIENAGYHGIYGYRSSLNISNAIIRNSRSSGVYSSYYYGGYDLTIRDSIIENNGGGIYWDMSYSGRYDATIEETIIRNNTGDGIKIQIIQL